MDVFSATDRYPVTTAQSRIYLCLCLFPYRIFMCGARAYIRGPSRSGCHLFGTRNFTRGGVRSLPSASVLFRWTSTHSLVRIYAASRVINGGLLLSSQSRVLGRRSFPFHCRTCYPACSSTRCLQLYMYMRYPSVCPFLWRSTSADSVTSRHAMLCLT